MCAAVAAASGQFAFAGLFAGGAEPQKLRRWGDGDALQVRINPVGSVKFGCFGSVFFPILLPSYSAVCLENLCSRGLRLYRAIGCLLTFFKLRSSPEIENGRLLSQFTVPAALQPLPSATADARFHPVQHCEPLSPLCTGAGPSATKKKNKPLGPPR